MRFTLTIDLGNDAMQAPSDVVDALHALGDRLLQDGYPDKWADPSEEGGPIRDCNGNTVGKWEVRA